SARADHFGFVARCRFQHGNTLFSFISKPSKPKKHEHTIDTPAIADLAFLCRRNGRKTGAVQNRTHPAIPQKIRSVQAVWAKKCRALDRARSDHSTQGRQPFRRLAHRPHGDRSREQIPRGHALPVNLSITSKKKLMTSKKSNTASNELPDLVSLLKAVGHEPVSTGGDEFGYASVFGK